MKQERASRWRMDLGPWKRSRDFRLLLISGLITRLGSMMTFVAVPFQVAIITDSYVAVGLIGAAELVPLVIFALYGGSLADRVDKRRMVIWTEFAAFILAIALGVNATLPAPSLVVIFVVTVLFAAIDGLQRPSLDALFPRVVSHDDLSAAGALNSLKGNVSSIAGPALAGLVLAISGAAAAYAIDALSFVISFVLLLRLRPAPPIAGEEHDSGLRHIAAGLRYAWSRKDLLGTYVIDLAAMTFAFPFALFPFVVQDYDAAWALGFLYAAGFIGAMGFSLTSGWAGHIRHQGRMIALAATLWGVAIALIAFAPSIQLVIALLAVAGFFDMMSGHFRMLMWNQSIGDDMRGRMAGIEMLSYSIGPMLGQVRSTTAAQLTSLRISFLTGGIACVAAVGIACAALPALWRYDAATDENVRAVRASRNADGSAASSD